MTNESAVSALLKKQLKDKKAVHAYIVESEKSEIDGLLKECAKAVLCENSLCGSCEVCKKINLGIHLDCLSLPLSNRARVLVEDIDFLLGESIKKPAENGVYRVFTINASESTGGSLNTIWQNKLLKTLEEPSENIFIFIGTDSVDGLQKTVVSRCQHLYAKGCEKKEIAESLFENGLSKNASQIAAVLSNGSLTEAQRIVADNRVMELFGLAFEILKNLKSTKNALRYIGKVFEIAESTSERESVKNGIGFFLKSLAVILRESVVRRLQPSLCILDSFEEDVCAVCKNYSLDAATECIEKIEQTQKRLQSQGNVNVEIDNLIVEILEVRYYAGYSRGTV